MFTQKRIIYILVGLVALGALYYFVFMGDEDDEKPAQKVVKNEGDQIYEVFTDEGNLTFYSEDSIEIMQIDIELAKDQSSISKGLMNRADIPDNTGMFFIFPDNQQRSFWMRNTQFSLDIIFVTKEKEILNIIENTQPYSEQSVRSIGPAKYVIEVKAGYTAKTGIKAGGYISFETEK